MTKTGLSNADAGGSAAESAPGATAPDSPPRPSRRRRFARRTAHSVGMLVGQAVTLAMILIFAALIRLQGKPLDLSVFAPSIEAAVNRSLGGSIEIGGVLVSMKREEDEPRVLLQDVKLRDADGRLIFSAPSFAARFDAKRLLSGQFAPTSLTLIGPTAVLTRTPEGAFRFGIGGGAGDVAAGGEAPMDEDDAAESPLDAFSTFAAGLAFPERRRDPFTALDSIAVQDAYLIYRDELSGRVWRAPGAFLRVWKGEDGARAFASVKLAGGGGAPTELTLAGQRLRTDDRVHVRANFFRLRARDLADQIPVFGWLRATDGALDGGLDLELAPDGGLLSLAGTLRADSVVAEIGGVDRLLDSADASFGFDAATNVFTIGHLEASALGVSASMSGTVALRMDENRSLTGADLSLQSLHADIARPDQFDDAVVIREGRAQAHLDLGAAPRIELTEAKLVAASADQPDTHVALKGEASQTEEGLAADFTATVQDFGIRQVVGLWPKALSTNGRLWVDEHIPQGLVRNTRATLRQAPGGEPDVRLEFEFEDTLSYYLGPMPPLSQARGAAGIWDGAFHLTLDSAVVETTDGAIDISGSTLEIRNLLGHPAVARPVIKGVGPGAAILNVIEHEPLRLPSKLGLSPSDVGGNAVATAILEFPLVRDLNLQDVSLDMEARMTALTMQVPNAEILVTADEVALVADETGMTVTGEARVDGKPASILWRENFRVEGGGPRRTLDFRTVYSSDEAVAAGAPRSLFREGDAPVSGRVTFTDGEAPRLSARADLKSVWLEARSIGWGKEAGVPASLALDGRLGGDEALHFDLESPGLEGEGRVRFPGAGVALDLKRMALTGVGEFSGTVTADGDKLDVALNSPSVDLERFLSEGSADMEGLDAPDIAISLNADGAHLTGALWAGALSGKITIKDGEKRARFNGLINGDAPFTGDFVGTGDETHLTLRSDEAGRALKALGALQSGRGGEMRLDLRLSGADQPIEGDIHIEDLVVTEAPVLAELLSLASLVGAVDKLASGGVTFTTIEADFRAEESLIHISDGAAYGPTVGLTAQGSVDLAASRFDLSGSISPAYVINGLVNAVPLLGEALTGGEGEGIFGIAYDLKGPASDPKISVNPLSVLAVGPFRRLFSGSSSGEGATESDAAPEGETWRDRRLKERDGSN